MQGEASFECQHIHIDEVVNLLIVWRHLETVRKGKALEPMLNFYNSCLRPYFGKLLDCESMTLDIIEHPYLCGVYYNNDLKLARFRMPLGRRTFSDVGWTVSSLYPVKVRGLAYSLLDTSSAIWGI
ncbi:hypothetical protein H5410_061914 [Solanum commersonii]|uniref:Uncharacterized protein n=1 Tax=Solanum commersonii TaxID=4109 RepID=A0A9J5WA60_SOLCO|nr:hypothetical protein H5410_061914 [Solanum commersonii]